MHPWVGGEKVIRIVIALVIWCFCVEAAITYGGIWQSQSSPTRNVSVQHDGGAIEVGSLQRSWSRDWTLVKSDGSTSNLKDLSRVIVSIQRPDEAPGYWALWRSWLPMILVSVVALLLTIYRSVLPLRQYGNAP